MDAVLRTKIAIGPLAFDNPGRRRNTSFLAFDPIDNLIPVAVCFAVTPIPAEKPLGPVMGFGSSGTRMELENGIGFIIRTGIENGFGKGIEILFQANQTLIGILKDILIPFLFQKVQRLLNGRKTVLKGLDRADLVFDVSKFAIDASSKTRVLPEGRILTLLTQRCLFFLKLGEVKDSLAKKGPVPKAIRKDDSDPKVLSLFGTPYYFLKLQTS